MHQNDPAQISFLNRVWQTIGPPSGGKKEFTSAQRTLLRGVLGAILLLAAAGGGYYYYSTAPDRSEAIFQQGMQLAGAGKFSEAVQKFDSAISTWDQHARAYLERGNNKLLLKRPDEALADFEQAAALDPTLAEAYTSRGMIFLSQGNKEKAAVEFTNSIKIRPTMDAYYQRAQIEAALNDHAKAIADYDQAIALNRAAPFIYSARAMSKKAVGDEDGAAEDSRSAYDLLHKPH